MKVTLVVNKECKHSVRYDSTSKDSPIDSVYVKKTGLPTPHPKKIELDLSF